MNRLRYAAIRLLALAVLLLPLAAAAHSYRLGEIAIGHLWTPPTEAGSEGAAVYGPLMQRGGEPVTLMGASSPAAAEVRIRRLEDGKASFQDRLVLEPGKPVSLAPWGRHLWLGGLDEPLTDGQMVPLTLDFGPAGSIDVEVMVEETPSD